MYSETRHCVTNCTVSGKIDFREKQNMYYFLTIGFCLFVCFSYFCVVLFSFLTYTLLLSKIMNTLISF